MPTGTVNRVVTKLMRIRTRDQETLNSKREQVSSPITGRKKVVAFVEKAELLDPEDTAW
ncbi:hypothetical protein M422DRAFT_37445 [Sphaerobolus stellatus SS14]|uniref:Uncharacterized protein n=1 Tax=Sphaerobolus stellatus (strain SS14) TaxID=990650 RepID=A0A0C9U214_SPHS4|nr:hypothetical protein M422DRAFT_37445 [Sphaerobolus stellatus SS14]